jgi:HlyD family secretion protein
MEGDSRMNKGRKIKVHMPKPSKEGIKKMLRPTKKKVVILCIILAAVLLVVIGSCTARNKKMPTNADATAASVTRGTLEVAISGSGAVEPFERYEIIPMVDGKILSSPFEVGDSVNEGDVLYQFDASDSSIAIQKQENALKKSALSGTETSEQADKLQIEAPCSGTVSGLSIKSGDDIAQGAQIASVKNDKTMVTYLPFNKEQVQGIYVGQGATLSYYTSSIAGKVTHVDSNPTTQANGAMLYSVTVEFTNPGAVAKGDQVGGEIGGIISPGYGTVDYSASGDAKSELGGTVSSIKVKNGDYVTKGQVIATLSSTTVSNSLQKSDLDYQDAQLSLQEQKNKLDDYSITSPINGTVLSKESKAGDTIDKTNASIVMMVVADISKLKFNLDIDELDISKVSVGQKVEVTADAVPGEKYTGEITKVSLEGTTENGVTTYTAEVVIYEPGNLRPSMNVDASVIVESADNALMVPVGAVKKAGGDSYVYVKSDAPAKKEKTKEGQTAGQMGAAGGKRAETVPDGYEKRTVETGISNDEYTQIINGLSEGDQVYDMSMASSTSDAMQMMMGGDPGGGPEGGPPSDGGGSHGGSSSGSSGKSGSGGSSGGAQKR